MSRFSGLAFIFQTFGRVVQQLRLLAHVISFKIFKLSDFQSSQVEFFESHSGRFCPEWKNCQTKLSSRKAELNYQVKLSCQSCLKSHSRRAGRTELVAPRQLSKTDSMKLSCRAILAEFDCLNWSSFPSRKICLVE